MVNADILVRQGHGRQLCLAETPHHDIVQHVNANGDQALHGDGQCQHQHAAIKALFHVK